MMNFRVPNIPPEFVVYNATANAAIRTRPQSLLTCHFSIRCEFTLYAASYAGINTNNMSGETIVMVRTTHCPFYHRFNTAEGLMLF
jgi:hypothetical protein